VSICETYVARSVGTEGVAAAVGGASSAGGSGRGPGQTNVLLKDVIDTRWYLASAKIVYRMERFRQSIGRCYLEFYGCYFRACWACLVFKGVFRACLYVSRPHALQKGACCTTLLLSSQFWPMWSKSRRGLDQLPIGQSALSG